VAGGSSWVSGRLSSAELYDPTTKTWSANAVTMDTARGNHTAIFLPSTGQVLVAGGQDENYTYLNTSQLYDPTTKTWSATTNSMADRRAFPTATLLPNGKVLVAGGQGAGSVFLNTSELYDPATKTWSTKKFMTAARARHTATLLPNGKVLVAGGLESENPNSSELYDPATNSWSATAGSMTAYRGGHTDSLLPSGEVLVAGGMWGGPLASSEIYNPTKGTWRLTGPLANGRFLHTATLLSGGKVLVAGGATSYTTLESCELYQGNDITGALGLLLFED
jgi:N-acetylneuraminic acid mutarotase